MGGVVPAGTQQLAPGEQVRPQAVGINYVAQVAMDLGLAGEGMAPF